jgi:serine protease Do
MTARAPGALLAALLLALPPRAPGADGARASAVCPGRYADTLSVMRASARLREARPAADWVYCLRATAIYEQLSYGRGGRVRRQYHRKVRHGTGFAYRERGREWLLVTNHHLVDFPEVTGEGVELEGVPAGARRVRTEVRIVTSEAEADGPGTPPLTEVVSDPALDVTVLASSRPLHLLPYRLGRSGELRVGDAVLARGYPLGAFPAANSGKVIGVGQRDVERGWDHEDFAVDALLNLGSSGSPVFAISCETGEPELVGIYHAGYRGAQGLNVVVAIDQLRPVLEELRAPPRRVAAPAPALDPAALRAALASGPLTFPFGGRVIRVERDGDALRFVLLDPAFPLSARTRAAILDPPGGRAERAKANTGDAAADAAGSPAELREALRAQLALVLAWRAAEAGGAGPASRSALGRLSALAREREEEQADLLSAIEAGESSLDLTISQRDASTGRTSEGPTPPLPERVERARPSR